MFRRLVLASIVCGTRPHGTPGGGIGNLDRGAERQDRLRQRAGEQSAFRRRSANDSDARLWVADYPSGIPVQVTTLPVESTPTPAPELVSGPFEDRLRRWAKPSRANTRFGSSI